MGDSRIYNDIYIYTYIYIYHNYLGVSETGGLTDVHGILGYLIFGTGSAWPF